jgi:hypothetical protein
MDLKVLHDVRFYDNLLSIDQELARRVREAGCLACLGRLDSARFPRKLRGCRVDLGPEHAWRLSFCCDRCRQRETPPSVRFLPHRVYFGAVLVLAGARKLSARWVATLNEELGVDRRTIRRWRNWWRNRFVESSLWRVRKGDLMPPVAEADLPASLLERFGGDLEERLLACLRWLAPLGLDPLRWPSSLPASRR